MPDVRRAPVPRDDRGMAHSPNRRQKGCGLCKPHKHKDASQAYRQPLSALRLVGKVRRVSRHDLGDQLIEGRS